MMQTVAVGADPLEVRRWPGSGIPVLLLHEGLGSVALWRDFPEALATATGREVIAWSRLGHGQSGALKDRRDPDYMHREAAAIPSLLGALRIPRAHFLGHSDGGSIALIAAASTPALVAGLILEAPHVYVEDCTLQSIAAVKQTYLDTEMKAKMARYHADPDHTFWRWNDIWLDSRFRDWNIEALLPKVAAPTLLIQGEDDQYGTLDQLDRIQAVLTSARRVEVPACGHSPHHEQRQAVLTAVGEFLRDRE